jgi:hypothetical protein
MHTPWNSVISFMQLLYTLWGSGWAKATVRQGRRQSTFLVSYATDALGDLVRAALDLLIEDPEVMVTHEDGRSAAEPLSRIVTWEDEPGLWEWELTLVPPAMLRVRLTEYPGMREEKGDGTVVLDQRTRTRDFARQVFVIADRVLRIHGIVGYRRTWIDHEFPLGAMLMLRAALTTAKPRALFPFGGATTRTKLLDELRALRPSPPGKAGGKPARTRR